MKAWYVSVWTWATIAVMAVLLVLVLPGSGPVRAQTLPTATPDADGIIYVQVQPNDSLWSIAARAGISLQELLELNDLSEDALIRPGDLLIIGVTTPVPTSTAPPPTVTPRSTSPPSTPTPTAVPPRTGICLLAFDDVNGNGRRDAGELLQAAVAFTIFNQDTVVANYVTDGVSEPHCIDHLAPGTYQVTRSVARNETLTTGGDKGVILQTGDLVELAFGATMAPVAAMTETAAAATPDGETAVATERPDRSSFWYIIGGLLLLGVIFFMMMRLRREK